MPNVIEKGFECVDMYCTGRPRLPVPSGTCTVQVLIHPVQAMDRLLYNTPIQNGASHNRPVIAFITVHVWSQTS